MIVLIKLPENLSLFPFSVNFKEMRYFMKNNLRSAFDPRQYMISNDFELYYYSDRNLRKVKRHTHDYYEFYFFLQGNIAMQIEQEVCPVRFGDMIMIPPGVPHQLVNYDSEIPYRRFVFWISQDYCRRLREISADYMYLIDYVQKNNIYLFHNTAIEFNSIQSRLLLLLEELHADRFGRDAQLSLLLNDLILHLNRVVYSHIQPVSVLQEHSLYQQLLHHIEEHLNEDLSLEKLAKEFFVSKYYIAHIFKNRTGISIHQYITKKRLALCREALLSNHTITETYQMFGFGDYSCFYRAFKKEYGISPKEFRDVHTSASLS